MPPKPANSCNLLHIRADRHVYCEVVAQVMATAAKSGLVRIGLVTDPTPPLSDSVANLPGMRQGIPGAGLNP